MENRSLTIALVCVMVVLTTIGFPACMRTIWSSRAEVPERTEESIQSGSRLNLVKLGTVPNLREPGYANLQFVSKLDGWFAEGARLWNTKDGGRNWELVFTAKSGLGVIYQLQFINAFAGWILAEQDLYQTRDGGKTWKLLPAPLSGGRISFFKFVDGGTEGWAAGVSDGDALSSRSLPTTTSTGQATASSSGRKFLALTHDGGKTWKLVRYPSASEVNIWAASSLNHLLAISIDIYYLTNGRWTKVDLANSNCSSQQLIENIDKDHEWPYGPVTTYFLNEKDGWLSFSNGFVAKTGDGGKTWCDLLEPKSVWPVAGLGTYFKRLYFANPMDGWGLDENGAIYRTNNGGKIWSHIASDMTFYEMYFLDSNDGWAISNEGVFEISL